MQEKTLDEFDEFDFVIAAIHSGFKRNKEEQTNRVLKVMDNKYVNCIGHPTGREFGYREGYELDWEKIFAKAKQKNIFIEMSKKVQPGPVSNLIDKCIKSVEHDIREHLARDEEFLAGRG